MLDITFSARGMNGDVVPVMQRYRREDYVETTQGTKFAHAAGLFGAANITLGTKTIVEPDSIIRGDLAKVSAHSFKPGRGGAIPASCYGHS